MAITVLPQLVRAQEGRDPASQEPSDVKIRMIFNGQTMRATLYDNPSARDLAAMLPLDMTMTSYNNNEKVAHLPRKLTKDGSGPFSNEQPGDICYYPVWGDLAMFYAGYRYSYGLIRLGRFDDGLEPLLTRREFPLRIELIQ